MQTDLERQDMRAQRRDDPQLKLLENSEPATVKVSYETFLLLSRGDNGTPTSNIEPGLVGHEAFRCRAHAR